MDGRAATIDEVAGLEAARDRVEVAEARRGARSSAMPVGRELVPDLDLVLDDRAALANALAESSWATSSIARSACSTISFGRRSRPWTEAWISYVAWRQAAQERHLLDDLAVAPEVADRRGPRR
jgi:hypothetical protein